jgi:hypothetical protein
MTIYHHYLYSAFPYEPMKDHAGHGTDGMTRLDYFVAASLACTPMSDHDGSRLTIDERASYAVSLALATLADIDRRLERSRASDLDAERIKDLGCM